MLPSIEAGQWILLPGQTPQGEHILSVLLKRTYHIRAGQPCQRAVNDKKLVSGDVHYDDPMNSSVQFESDFIPWKLATDIVFNATAYAPEGKASEQFIASLMVGDMRKDLLITGKRTAHYQKNNTPLFSAPEPITQLALRYEEAYGGVDIYSDLETPCAYARNPLGKGFAIKNTEKAIEGLLLPQIESPNDLLTPERLLTEHFMHWQNQPMPAGIAWFTKTWQPRASYAGVMPADRKVEQQLRKAYTKAVPEEQQELYQQTSLPDMDFRFFNGASAGLALPYLLGDEVIKMRHLTPEGKLVFQLPNEKPQITIDIGQGLKNPESVLQTVMVRMDNAEVDLVWRAAIHYPGADWLPQMKTMELSIL